MYENITLKRIIENKGFNITHNYDARQKEFFEQDITTLFEMFGADEHIDEFVKTEFTTLKLEGLFVDSVALDKIRNQKY